MPKINIQQLNLQAGEDEELEMAGISEYGPWSVTIGNQLEGDRVRVSLQSCDFTHDVALAISGDFRSTKQKIMYAEALAKRMNRMPSE